MLNMLRSPLFARSQVATTMRFKPRSASSMAAGLQFDLNYSLSKCIDLGSTRESDGPNGPQGSGLGLVQNPWNPGQMRAVCDYDVRSLVSAFMVAELPFGRGRRFAQNTNKFVKAIIAGWQLSGIWRQSSAPPVGVGNGGYWPPNWNYPPFATQVGQFHAGTTKNSSPGGPNLFPDPAGAFSAFELTFPRQSGSRNVIRGDGFFTIDTGMSKRFGMFYSEKHNIEIRAEAFNVSNSIRFDANQLSLSLSNSIAFGKYSDSEYSSRISVRRTL
jgi:hypothetical protein